MKKVAVFLAIAALASCTAGGTTKQSGVPTLRLLAENLQLFPGAGQAVRIGFQTATGSADIIASKKTSTLPKCFAGSARPATR